MADTILVAPVEGASLPLEANPRRRVDREMAVPNTRYYREAIRKGDLVDVVAAKKAAKAAPKKEG
jgi:hypothetical protein